MAIAGNGQQTVGTPALARVHATLDASAVNPLLFFFVEGGVEGELARFEVDLADELTRFPRPVVAVHASVFPFD